MQPNDQLIAREAELPGLSLLLDPDALARRLGLGPLKLEYLRLKHGTSCAACYRLGDDWLAAKAVTLDRVQEFSPPLKDAAMPEMIIPELGVKVFSASRDRHMRGLTQALDPRRQADFLAMLEKSGVRASALRPLKLKPQRRLVAMLEQDGAPSGFLKIQSRDRFAPTLMAASISQYVGGPALLHADARSGAIVTEWLPGKTLMAETATADELALAGTALARAHGFAAQLPMMVTRRDEIAGLKAMFQDCAELLPELGPQLRRISDPLCAHLLSQPQTLGLIHGDFSADQVLLQKGVARLIDWDRAAIGDQAADLGCFIARLEKDALDQGQPAQTAHNICNHMLEGYAQHRALPRAFHAQKLRHLTLLLTEDFRLQRPDWDQRIARLADYIEGQLPAQTQTGVDATMPLDPQMPWLPDALSKLHMQPLLNTLGHSLTGTPQLLRHKPGKRAIIGYPTPSGRILGKTRSKGLDRRTILAHRNLRALGLDGRGPNPVEVPDILGQDHTLAMWLMPELPGPALTQLIGRDAKAFARTGHALARLHDCDIDVRRDWHLPDETKVLTKALGGLADDLPQHAATLGELVRRARRVMAALPGAQTALLHRDFYPDQVLVPDERIILLDLDLLAMGDPAIDLGNFIAHLHEDALRQKLPLDAFDADVHAFLSAYHHARPGVNPDRITLLGQISLLRHLAICQRFPDRRHYFDRLLDHGLQISAAW